jgi:hypothetical protein
VSTSDWGAAARLLHTRRQAHYAARAGTGLPEAELERLWQRLQPLAIGRMQLSEPPPRGTRFGSPLVLSRVHWVRPEMVVELSYVEWTPDGLLRHVVYGASAKISWEPRCDAADLMLPSLNRGKISFFRERHVSRWPPKGRWWPNHPACWMTTGGNRWRRYESSIIRSAYSNLPPWPSGYPDKAVRMPCVGSGKLVNI